MIKKLLILGLLALIIVIPVASADLQQHTLTCEVYDNTSTYSYDLAWTSDSNIQSVCAEYGYIYNSGGNKATFTVYNIGDSIFSTSNNNYATPKSIAANKGRFTEYARCYEIGHAGNEFYGHWLVNHRLSSESMRNTYCSVILGGEPDFSGYPLDGYSPLSVGFTATNMTNTTGLIWSFGDGNVTAANGTTINHVYQDPGIYSVRLDYVNSSGVSGSVQKNNYVLASTPSGLIVNLDVKSAISPNPLIQDATVSIRNTTTGVWRNTTAPTGLVYFSTTDPGYLYSLTQNQSITLCANKTGYSDACETFNIPYNNYKARLFMMPNSVINATGTGTVVVNVISNKNKLTVSGMSVVMDTGQIGVTSRAGAITLYNVTAGERLVKVTDPDGAYQPTEKTFTLAEGDTELIVVEVVREGEDPIDTPVSPTPTPTGTYDPNDPNSPVYGNYTTSEINQQGGAGILGMLAQLITLWPLVVLGIFMKFMKSAFS
jgi:PKD repeat protein